MIQLGVIFSLPLASKPPPEIERRFQADNPTPSQLEKTSRRATLIQDQIGSSDPIYESQVDWAPVAVGFTSASAGSRGTH